MKQQVAVELSKDITISKEAKHKKFCGPDISQAKTTVSSQRIMVVKQHS